MPVIAIGSRGWPGGGHAKLPARRIMNAMIRPAKNITSAPIRISTAISTFGTAWPATPAASAAAPTSGSSMHGDVGYERNCKTDEQKHGHQRDRDDEQAFVLEVHVVPDHQRGFDRGDAENQRQRRKLRNRQRH